LNYNFNLKKLKNIYFLLKELPGFHSNNYWITDDCLG